MMRPLVLALILGLGPPAWADVAPYCDSWAALIGASETLPTRAEQNGCRRRLTKLNRICRHDRNKSLSICVTGVLSAGCENYIPSVADCDAGGYVCSGMPAAGDIPANTSCYWGGGGVLVSVPARTDVLPIPLPSCGFVLPPAKPKHSELRRCTRALAWFRDKFCISNPGIAACVVHLYDAGCLPYAPSDADCIAGQRVCAVEPGTNRCHL